MKRSTSLLVLLLVVNDSGWAARCTTAVNTRVLEEYDSYVRSAEQSMAERFLKGLVPPRATIAADCSWICKADQQCAGT